MREGWNTAKLADLCEFRNGLWKGKKPPFVHVGVIRNTNFRADGSLDDSDIAFLDVEQRQFEKRSLQYGDLILEKSGGGPKQPVGRVVLFDKKDGLFSFSNFTSVIRVLDSSRLDFNYLHRVLYWYYLSGTTESMQRRSTGIRNLEFSAYKALDIPLPPLPEQKRIVAILDEAFAGITTAVANTEKNLANARELFDGTAQAIFLSAEDWEEHTLSELLETGWITSHLDGNHGSEYPRKSEFVAQGVPYISANCLKNDAVDFHGAKFLTRERAASIRKGIARDGDVLFAHNATVGPVALLRTEFEKVILSTSLTYYRCNPDYIASGYLAHYMRSPLFRRQYESVMRQSTRNQVPITMQRRFVHLIPPIERQREIAEQLDSLSLETRRLERNYQQKLSALGELKQSLLQKAFSGQLATAPRDEIETALA